MRLIIALLLLSIWPCLAQRKQPPLTTEEKNLAIRLVQGNLEIANATAELQKQRQRYVYDPDSFVLYDAKVVSETGCHQDRCVLVKIQIENRANKRSPTGFEAIVNFRNNKVFFRPAGGGNFSSTIASNEPDPSSNTEPF